MDCYEDAGAFNWRSVRSVRDWLKEKRRHDACAEERELWRVHDSYYDLTEFIHQHPGGSHWLSLTRGTDVTEAFEASHLFQEVPLATLAKYKVREASKDEIPRKSRFTFHQRGFYKILQRKAAEALKDVGTGPTTSMKLMQDALAVSFVSMFMLSASNPTWPITVAAGILLGMTISCAHNFFHQRPTFRTYYFDLGMFNSDDWLVSHVLSHHFYTNTFKDFELTGVYPLASFFSMPKSYVHKNWAPVYIHPFFALVPIVSFTFKAITAILGKAKYGLRDVIPWMQLLVLFWFSDLSLGGCLRHWLSIHCLAGYWIAGGSLFTTHHHPSVYHAGDMLRPETDWGLHQMDTTNDVDKEKHGGFILAATTFGDHLLHHLFPTVDHSKLHLLYPALHETCKEFGVDYGFSNAFEMALGMHSQLRKEEANSLQDRLNIKP